MSHVSLKSLYFLQDEMVKKVKADGFTFVNVVSVKGSGRKTSQGPRGLRYRIELKPSDDLYKYIQKKLYRCKEQNEAQKMREEVKKLRKKKITKLVSHGKQLVPMCGFGNSKLNEDYIPGYESDEFKQNGVAPPNLSKRDLQLYDTARQEAMEQQKKYPSSPSNSNSKVCSFSLYSVLDVDNHLITYASLYTPTILYTGQ